MCKRYAVSAVDTQFGAATPTWDVTANPGLGVSGSTEETTISFSGLQKDDQVNVEFKHVEDVEPTILQCSYQKVKGKWVASSATWDSACD